METIYYLVPWIEVEYGWGDRHEGYKIFSNLDECIYSTKESFKNGNYETGGGYFGPINPLCYYETLTKEPLTEGSFIKHLPKFHSIINYIK
jgi:hypothetical protein